MEFEHKSVLLDETIEGLEIKPDGIYVDGTMGGAGHSSVILSKLGANGRLVCIDQDEDAIRTGTQRIGSDDRVKIVRCLRIWVLAQWTAFCLTLEFLLISLMKQREGFRTDSTVRLI